MISFPKARAHRHAPGRCDILTVCAACALAWAAAAGPAGPVGETVNMVIDDAGGPEPLLPAE
jgi:hypothetical protein